ncbi:hypothetical protein cypCar_00045467 [Cyprinus carpio]|nr:hypothetical protein cypCar_00045467 [Cyprinus carpio]
MFEVALVRSGRLMFLTDFNVLRRAVVRHAGILLRFQRTIQSVDRRESFALHPGDVAILQKRRKNAVRILMRKMVNNFQ